MSLLVAAFLTLLACDLPPLLNHYTRGDLHVAYQSLQLDPDTYASSPITPPRDWTIRTWQWSRGPGLRREIFSECLWMGSMLGSSESTHPNRTRIVVSSGWPLLAAEFTESDPPMPRNFAGQPATWLRYGIPITYHKRVPTRFHPLALLINLAAWTVLTHLAFVASRVVRTRRRRRRGLCPACAYAMSDSPICPECGEPAPRPPATLSRG